jgi:hypothetical protein
MVVLIWDIFLLIEIKQIKIFSQRIKNKYVKLEFSIQRIMI